MSYIKSLRFKLMKLCVIPLLSVAALFIGHSVVIAHQVRSLAANAQAGAGIASLSLGFLGTQWAIVFAATFVVFFIPITINIKNFIKPIRELAKAADQLAEGQVDIEIEKNRTDELGVLQESFQRVVGASKTQAALISRIADGDLTGNYTPRGGADTVGHSLVNMLRRNHDAISGVKSVTEQFVTSSAQIAEASQTLAQGATEQAVAVQSLSDDVSKIAGQVADSAERSRKAAALSERILKNAHDGRDKMEKMLTIVQQINTASQNIGKVIKIIDDIAFQTNILALNAAVEAARAGQHGKGFAVVADEVRNLAAKSALAAKDTGELIAGSMEKAASGEQIAVETAEGIAQIVTGMDESNSLIRDISSFAEAQAAAVGSINQNILQISQVVQQNSATAEESAAASEEMSGQADMLKDLIAYFQLKRQGDGSSVLSRQDR